MLRLLPMQREILGLFQWRETRLLYMKDDAAATPGLLGAYVDDCLLAGDENF